MPTSEGDIGEGVPLGARFHDALATGWADRYRTGTFFRRLEFLRREFSLLLLADRRWLDAGCGSGVFSAELASRDAIVCAADASPRMIEEASRFTERLRGQVNCFLVRSLDTLPFCDEDFDGAICLSVLEYLEEPHLAVRELQRVIRPNGDLMLTVPNSASVLRLAQRAIRCIARLFGRDAFSYLSISRNAWSGRQLRQLLENSGFRVRRLTTFSPYFGRLLGPIRMGALLCVVATRR
jgi:2-polyprenyl-3-methyl-5-hydroxy-6-metoxy-1,4-benzoquinol methylase